MFDAAGKIPAERTAREKAWALKIESGELYRRMEALKNRQALPLAEKIELSSERIREWYEAFEGRVAVSFSGGKDSAVLLWLVRRIYPDVPAVFCNTGLEYPEINHLVKKTPNTTIIRPRIPFHHVIRTYGWPVISKKVARGLSVLRHPTKGNQNVFRLYDEGVNRFGEKVNGFRVTDRWRFLVDAPFPISDQCCRIMKKDPMHRYGIETGRTQFVGTMASDSKDREKVYLQTGCNAFDLKTPRSAPLSFWHEQDILECIARHGIEYASVYGRILETARGYQFSGVSSTGCVFCAFGLHMEGSPNRFQLLKASHPHLWDFCMGKLGLGAVLSYIRGNCPVRSVARKFDPEPRLRQMDFFQELG